MSEPVIRSIKPDEDLGPFDALDWALCEAGRDAVGYAPDGGLSNVVWRTIPYLRQAGNELRRISDDDLAAVNELLDGFGDAVETKGLTTAQLAARRMDADR